MKKMVGYFINKWGNIQLTYINTHKTVILENIRTHENVFISGKGFISIAKTYLKKMGYKVEKIK
jgi:hypothetical protein